MVAETIIVPTSSPAAVVVGDRHHVRPVRHHLFVGLYLEVQQGLGWSTSNFGGVSHFEYLLAVFKCPDWGIPDGATSH